MRFTSEDEDVMARLTAAGEALVQRAVSWSEIPSGSRNLAGLEAQAAALLETLGAFPGEVERVPLEPSIEIGADGAPRRQTHPDALKLTVRPQAPLQVVLTGHYDTVYPADSAFTTVRTRADGALNGPGLADMKGGISIALGALAAFERHPLAERVGYQVLLSPDEEIGSPASAALLARIARQGHIGMTYEPCLPDGALAGARKGSGNFHIVVEGRAAHAGRDFAAGRNAVACAASLAAALHGLNGLRDGLTVNIGRIDGGGPLNIVPDRAVLRLNVRAPSLADGAWFEAALAEAEDDARADGLLVRRHGAFTRPPKAMDAAQRSLFEAAREVGMLIGLDLAWRPSGGVCEGNNLHAAGLPNIDTLGVQGGEIHSEDEYALPASFATRARLSAALLIKIASGEIDVRAMAARLRADLAAAES
jgi:glutamate carboxypeptidase